MHLAHYIVQRLFDHAPEEGIAFELPGLQIGRRELGLVVEHLLEMRHEPLRVDAIAMKAAACMVVNAAHGHMAQAALGETVGAPVARAPGLIQRQQQQGFLGKLGGAGEAAECFVFALVERLQGLFR